MSESGGGAAASAPGFESLASSTLYIYTHLHPPIRLAATVQGETWLSTGPNAAGQNGLRLAPGEVGKKQALFGGFCIILRCLVGSGE